MSKLIHNFENEITMQLGIDWNEMKIKFMAQMYTHSKRNIINVDEH